MIEKAEGGRKKTRKQRKICYSYLFIR